MKSCIIVLDILILVIAFKNGQCCDTECSFSEWKEESICHDGVAKWSRTICCKSNPHDLTKCLAACKVSLENLEKIENCNGDNKKFRPRRSISVDKKCVPVDLVFVMDDSGSVSEENFQTMLTFASDLLNSFKIGEQDTRVGLITFSTSARRIFNFDAYSLRTQIQTAIKETLYNAGGTNTAAALREAQQMFVLNDAKRSNALSLAIVLTDGKSNIAADTVNSANALHNADVMVFCIGIGSNLNEDELRAIASNPDDKFLINANDFTTLHSKITQLTNSLCIDDVIPNFETCDMEIQDNNGERSPQSISLNQPTSCNNQRDFYGKYQVDRVISNITVDAEYTGNKPNAVEDFHYGITQLTMTRLEKSMGGYDTILGVEHININNPPQRLVSSDKIMENSGHLVNGERFCLLYTAKSGGYVTFGSKTYTYSDTVATKTRCYFFDSDAPQHCKILGTCTQSPVMVPSPVTNTNYVTVSFQGWEDVSPSSSSSEFSSGIQHYELYVYEMVSGTPGKLTMDTTPKTGTLLCEVCSSFTVSLPTENQPMLYAFVLEVVDVALNARQARTFILFDNVSEIVTHPQQSLVVTSASLASNRIWQTNRGDVCYGWQNLFYNDKFVHYNPLLPIAPVSHGLIPPSYDIFPGHFSSTGTQNIHGIVNFTFSVSREDINIYTNKAVSNGLSETMCLSIPAINDGDNVSFSITAYDISLNNLTESIYHYIDSSPPFIENAWLTKSRKSQLFVHNSTDLSKMIVDFESFDLHSGLFKIEWTFGISDNNQILGFGAIGIKKMSASICSMESKCYCPVKGDCEYYNFTISLNSLTANNSHIGNHHRGYFFDIKATNNAFLYKTHRLDIFVDDSPPEKGQVFDGPQDGSDVDYTDSKDIFFHWQGFNDHESGIMFYRIKISNVCLSQQDDSSTIHSKGIHTFDTEESEIKINVNGTGLYIATVIAFNHAYEASSPVCSDGVLYDNTSPIISTVKIQNLKMAPAVGCLNGKAWFVNNFVEKHSVQMSNQCYSTCNNKTNHNILEFIRESTFSTKDWICSNVNDFEKTLFYLPSSRLRVNWTVFDNESDVMEVFIGFGSNLHSDISPDIMDFKSSPHQQYGEYFHSGISSNYIFYLFVKAVNKAGKATTTSIGPIVIDETAPDCSNKPNITIENTTLVMKWSPDSFQDLEQEEEIGVIHYRLRTRSVFSSPYFNWTSVINPKCENGLNCIRINVKDIRSVTKNGDVGPYYVEIQAYNYIGSFCSMKTGDIYIPSMSPPHLGELLDILPLKENDPVLYVDVAVSLNHSIYCVALLGFEFHADHKYEIGVGSLESQSNVIPLHTIHPNTRNVFCENTTNVVTGQNYYVMLKATNRFNMSSTVSSNGVVFLNDVDIMKTATIQIGESCQYSKTLENYTRIEFLNGSLKVFFNFPLEIGERYTLFLNNVSCSEAIITGHSASVLCIKNSATFVPYIHFPNVVVQNISQGFDFSFVTLKKCSDDVKVLRSSDHVSISWKVDHSVLHLITHFKVALLQTCYMHALSNCTSVKLFETNIAESTFHTTLYTGQKLRTGRYVFTLQFCFSNVCTTCVFSEKIHIEESPIDSVHFKSKIEYVIDSPCLNVELDLQKGECMAPYPYNFAQFYRWGIFDDENGIKQLSPLFAFDSTEFSYSTVKKRSVCTSLPVHVHRPLFSCVESYCASGVFARACQQVKIMSHHNNYPKDIVYDLNAYSEEILTLEKYKFSSNIGAAMKTLSALEFNFGRKTKVAGFLLNVGNRNVTWAIMKKPQVPRSCANDPNCVFSSTSIGGFITFSSKTPLDENVLYYLCANVSLNENSFLSGVQRKRSLCSNGFVLDNEPPVTGFVKVDNVHQGYLQNLTEIKFFWHGFQDDTTYELLGYESGISKYSSCLGTSPCTDDIRKCREIGLKQWDMETNLYLTPGLTYYLGIKAFDHVGNTACASSDPFVYDPSPPIQGNVIVGHISKHYYSTSRQRIKVFWNGFSDPESGIKSYEIGIGTTPALDDIIRFYAVGQDSEDILTNDHVVEGHIYFILLLAENHAGLKTVATSLPFLVDYSPPSLGTVLEGLPGKTDMDFVSSVNFTCNWSSFEDPHSQLDHYKIGLGTYPFGTNMQPLFNIGIQNEWTWNLPLREGVEYFTIVEACNSAGLCSQATSNGITIDETPPIPGVIFGGRIGSHLRYYALRTTLEFQIHDFYDLHSGISHFEICVGTSRSVCDIEGKKNIRLETSGTLYDLNLPEHTEIFMILTAWNKAGLSTVTSSDGIQIDTSSPILSQIPTISNSNRYGFVIDRSFLNISWYFYDNNTPIVRCVVNIKSHHGRHVDVHLSAKNFLTLSLKKNDWLQNGNTYYFSVTACNAAELCSTANGENFTVDSTPPHFGHFLDGTWSNLESKIELHIKNFSDFESGVIGYFVAIGETYGSDGISKGIIYFQHFGNWNDKQQITIKLYRNLTVNEKIYLSLWSSNRAGLNSSIRHFALFVSRTLSIHEGHLILEKHSCNAEYCNYDCTCSVFKDKCTELVSTTPTCSETNITNLFSVFTVKIGLKNGNKFSLSSQCLHAQWERNTSHAKRHEWSFGIEGRPIGFGIFDSHSEQVWHDVSNNNNVIHCLSNNRSLEHGRSYIAYLKAWWSFSDFTIFQSEPMLVDLTPPSVRRGKYIVDSNGDCTRDIDYISSNNITTCWGNVFSDQQSGMFCYKVYIGTHPGGDDITGEKNVGNETTRHWYNLDLRRNVVYYATVEAVNNLGATTIFTSDGFSIDDEPPHAGVVYTSENFRDNTWLTNENQVCASWEGFTDHDSSIVEYYVALQNKHTMGQKAVSFISIGIQNKYSFMEIELNGNDAFFILVKAKDAAGYFSETVSSKAILVDATEPVSLVCESYSLIFRYNNVFGNNITTNETHFEKGRIYSITIQSENFPNLQQVIISMGNASKTVNFETVNGDTFFSNYSFFSQIDGYQSIRIELFDAKNTKGNITFRLFQCNTEKEVEFGGVSARQVSPSDILVSFFVADFESGLADTLIKVANTRNGCPILSIRTNGETGTHYVSVPVAHQSSIFVSIVAKNNAGKEKTFYSSGLTMDHTPPDLQQKENTYTTTENNGHWDTQVNIRWNADEQESYLQFCQCAFGTVSGSENLQEWSESSISECVSKPLSLAHGSYVYPKVRCRNSVGLAKEINFDPAFVVYKTPVPSQTSVKFSVHNVHSKNHKNYQRFNTSLYFYWEEFGTSTQSTTYNFCVKENNEILRNWTDIGRHTYTSVDGLKLKTGKVYSAEIYALNSKNLRSNVLNSSVLISDVIPVQKGNSCRLENSTKIERSYILTWEDVFEVNQNFDPWYTAYVGSDKNYNNVLHGISTDKRNVTLTDVEPCGNLYVVIIAKYATGTQTTYREELIRPCP